ncbi:hypothetical protein NPIL_460791 [Nephila pilipes]|uniref:Uncharacterized protein n=1 Tax=Nephila pilipes TaxID=299642 RepID=A0A8X6PLL0_NEPPI|nr:hypothetical protein NPIL_460791 [Nephila pilipes]
MSFDKEKPVSLKRKRSIIGAAITKLITKMNDPTSEKTDLQYSFERLQDKINEQTLADDKIHELLRDEEYNENIIDCEKYAENAYLAMFTYKKKANTNTNFSSKRSPISDSINNTLPPIVDGINYASAASNITVKITTFCGEIEEFHSFWERFENCIDMNVYQLLTNMFFTRIFRWRGKMTS